MWLARLEEIFSLKSKASKTMNFVGIWGDIKNNVVFLARA